MRTIKVQRVKGEEMLVGQVYTVRGQTASVKTGEEFVECGLRGTMRKSSVVVGDYVCLDEQNRICGIEQRKSFFTRPNVANVDYVNLVIAPLPKPDFLVVDKMLANIEKGGAKAIITVNKTDIEMLNIRSRYEKAVERIFEVSSLTGKNIANLKDFLKGKTVAFTGQSAVGKTSILNALFGENFKVGQLSEKILRGKNTTTNAYIYEKDDIKVVDTPGFTALVSDGIDCKNLKEYYPEFKPFSCFYSDCVHINEPDCAVKEAVEKGGISLERYEGYVKLYNEIKNTKR